MLVLAIEHTNPSSMSATAATAAVGRFEPDAPPTLIATDRAPADNPAHTPHTNPPTPPTRHPASATRDALAHASLTPRDIQAVAVSVGPGGYTATRIAVATAASFANALSIPAIAVPTHHAAAHAFIDRTLPLRVALAWKRDNAFLAVFPNTSTAAQAAELAPLEQLADTEPHILAADDRLIATLRDRGLLPASTTARTITLDATLVLAAAHLHANTDPARLRPLYPREPEAVTKWRHRQTN